MNEDIFDIAALIKKHFLQELTEQERVIFNNWLDSKPGHRKMFEEINDPNYVSNTLRQWDRYDEKRITAKIAEQLPEFVDGENRESAPVTAIGTKHSWLRYAAAVLLLIGVGVYVVVNRSEKRETVHTTSPIPMPTDIAPGGNRATLTLADGRTIVLDSAGNGILADQSGTLITKTAEGKIAYNPALTSLGKNDVPQAGIERAVYNTMTTPRGGQYQLTLPDGSQVWLNAESAITYPTAFTGKERKVTIAGEAYFEVAKNKAKPFIVDIGSATIEVLGTHFNANTYKEESIKNITLLEGRVQIKTVHTSLTLQPGQQGQFNPDQEKLSLAVNPDVEQVMAWKNGKFSFNGMELPAVMRQLARWYDLDLAFEGDVSHEIIGGEMGRDLTLLQIQRILKKMDVRFRLEGKKMIVSP